MGGGVSWVVSTQSQVLSLVQKGIADPEGIAKEVGRPVEQVHTHLARLCAARKIRKDGERWVIDNGCLLARVWK